MTAKGQEEPFPERRLSGPEGSINGVNTEKLPEGRHAIAGRGFRPALRHRCKARSSGQHLLFSPSSCSSCSPPKVSGRGRARRAWIAIRDMDVPAEIIGIRPLRTKLLAFLSSFYRGIAGAVRAFM